MAQAMRVPQKERLTEPFEERMTFDDYLGRFGMPAGDAVRSHCVSRPTSRTSADSR
jgi:hypothetical protein